MWFEDQSAACLADALERFETHARDFMPTVARRQALRFNQRRFAEELLAYLDAVSRPAPLPARRAA